MGRTGREETQARSPTVGLNPDRPQIRERPAFPRTLDFSLLGWDPCVPSRAAGHRDGTSDGNGEMEGGLRLRKGASRVSYISSAVVLERQQAPGTLGGLAKAQAAGGLAP